ncbi:MAG TPA: argininosuccinate lyase [bacterium]|nr:argininosuccinate lyase [bacterium]
MVTAHGWGSERFTSRLGSAPAFPATPFYQGDPRRDAEDALNRDLQLHKAHVVMLEEEGIISVETAKAILAELLDIERLGIDALFLDPSLGLYLSTEKCLVDRLGADVAGRMHTARSRNDLEPANSRMYVRDAINRVVQALIELKRALLLRAADHVETVMPGYTHHSQHAQPITFAHYLLASHDAFSRDIRRFEQAYAVVNLSPMGGCALAGTGFPINRGRVAGLLGFDGIVENSLDATGHVDFLLQSTAAIAIALSNLGRMSEGLYLWNTSEFGMLELADEYCSISSIMPQKKNPVALEMIRGESILVASQLNGMMGVLKALPPGGGREWGYVDRAFPGCVNTALGAIKTMAGIVSTLVVKPDVMARRAAEGFSTVTELADQIVRHADLSFRQAHHIVGLTTLEAVKTGKKADEITGAMLDAAAEKVIGRPLGLDDQVAKKALDPSENVRIRSTIGGPAPDEVRRMIEVRHAVLAEDQDRLGQRRGHLTRAAEELRDAVTAIINR